MLSTPLCNTGNFTAQRECALKTANVGLIQSFNDELAKEMCLSALGWAVFAVLQVSSLDSWETAPLTNRDELNTWQMYEEAKQHWRRKPDISLVETVIWRGNRVKLEISGQSQLQMDFKGCVCMCVYVCVCTNASARTEMHLCVCACVPCLCAVSDLNTKIWATCWNRKIDDVVKGLNVHNTNLRTWLEQSITAIHRQVEKCRNYM